MQRSKPHILPLLLFCLLTLSACQQTTIIPQQDKLLPPPINTTSSLSTLELVNKYNTNLRELDYLRSNVTFDLKYLDEDGDANHENGSGNFYFQPPRDITLVLKKAGIEIFWAGANPEYYWLFDLHSDKLFYGQHKFASNPQTLQLAIPIQPQDVAQLLGLQPLEPTNGANVDTIRGYTVLQFVNTNFRYFINPDTGLPARIDYLDPITSTPLITTLLTHDKAYTDHSPSPNFPAVADIYAIDSDAYLKLRLHDYTHRKPNPRLFDLNAMIKVHKPKEILQLDADVPGSDPITN
ncbi:hypothetical protein [Poriferisphaera corsica]|uniref:hypothetical protein n=1 Tax=Poriferisphaera corsica TaxID=2528020 RepID=UPI0011A74B0B|nr:hypothetical protein [Poriferisphaera corsica]